MAINQRISDAHKFEDKVVAFINKQPGYFAGLTGNRNNSPDVQAAMRWDIQGFLRDRALPDIYVNVNGVSYFIDAKNSPGDDTGNHLADVCSLEALLAHQKFSQRTTLLAFPHPGNTIGFMTLNAYVAGSRGPYPTRRNSDAKFFRLARCGCELSIQTFFDQLLARAA